MQFEGHDAISHRESQGLFVPQPEHSVLICQVFYHECAGGV